MIIFEEDLGGIIGVTRCLMGDMTDGEIHSRGGNEVDYVLIGESIIILKNSAAKYASQKPSTANRWNMIRHHG